MNIRYFKPTTSTENEKGVNIIIFARGDRLEYVLDVISSQVCVYNTILIHRLSAYCNNYIVYTFTILCVHRYT